MSVRSKPQHFKNYFVLFLLAIFTFSSCKKESTKFELENNSETNLPIFPKTQSEREIAALNKEIGNVLETVYQNAEALSEVNAAIYSGFERDESITIKHLLQPTASGLYKFGPFIKMNIKPGVFKRTFEEVVFKGNFPEINKFYANFLGSRFTKALISNRIAATPDSSLIPFEIWVVNNVQIYFPYSENFTAGYRPDNTSGINKTDERYLVTLVSADRDADSGPGREPYLYWPDRTSPKTIKFKNVTVNDDYAELTATHMVSINEGTMDPAPPINPPPISTPIYKVYVGWVKCTKQYDRLISLNGNGGGSELRFGRGYAFQETNGQVKTDYPFVSANITRKNIRKKTWVRIATLWDTNWLLEQIDHSLGIYEEDNINSITFNASVSGKFTIDGSEVTTTVGISFTKPSQDEIIRNINVNRDFFFHDGVNDQGWGFKESWPIYDGSSYVSYTLPYQIVY